MRLGSSCRRASQIGATLLITSTLGLASQSAQKARFGAPELLRVGEAPLNATAKQMYPSPAVFDVDRDGRDELVVGCISGRLSVYENEAQEGEPTWSEPRALKSVDGKDIKVSNW